MNFAIEHMDLPLLFERSRVKCPLSYIELALAVRRAQRLMRPIAFRRL
jgi:hypothetical protein